MNDLNIKIEQCRRNITILENQLQELCQQQKDLETPKPKHGDIVRLKSAGVIRIIIEDFKARKFTSHDYHGYRCAGGLENVESVEQLYQNGTYKVVGNIFTNVWK